MLPLTRIGCSLGILLHPQLLPFSFNAHIWLRFGSHWSQGQHFCTFSWSHHWHSSIITSSSELPPLSTCCSGTTLCHSSTWHRLLCASHTLTQVLASSLLSSVACCIAEELANLSDLAECWWNLAPLLFLWALLLQVFVFSPHDLAQFTIILFRQKH